MTPRAPRAPLGGTTSGGYSRGEALVWQSYISQYLCFSRSSGITTSPLYSETGLHAINVDRYFDRAVPLSFETRFLRIVGEALDTQPARPAQ